MILSAVKEAQSEANVAQVDVVMNAADVVDKAVEEQVVAIKAGQSEVLEDRLWSHGQLLPFLPCSFGSHTFRSPSNRRHVYLSTLWLDLSDA